MAKKLPLEVGQTVWLESRSMISSDVSPKLRKMVVQEANKSSAYIWYDDNQTKGSQSRIRVSQKNYEVYSFFLGYHERIWLSEEEYQTYLDLIAKKKEVRNLVMDFVSSSDRKLQELEAIQEFIHSLKEKQACQKHKKKSK